MSKKFRSGFERTIATSLSMGGHKYDFEPCSFSYTLTCEYTPDFKLDNGIYIETKGRLDSDEKRKYITVRTQHPEIDLRFVFMKEGTKCKGSNQTQEAWASRNNFKYSIGEIPQEWLDE